MGLMNKAIGLTGILIGLLLLIFRQDLILSVALIILGIIFIIFNEKEEEFEKRTDEK